MGHTHKNFKTILKAPYTLTILLRIYEGYRPSQIAKFLHTTEQALHYHINQLITVKLIEKSTENGIIWKLTPKGLLILKELLSRSVNSSHNNNSRYNNSIPVRLHNVSFSFNIMSINGNLRLRWKPINNGVLKCFIRYPNHTLEITKSPNKGESVLIVHLSEEYVFDPLKGLLKQYDLARHYASLAAQRLRFVISDNDKLVKKPHFAFEYDIIALHLATFQTAEISTAGGMTWIDSSQGRGELETNDIDYAYKYLKMPENIMDVYEAVNWLKRKSTGYARHYDPILTDNN
jgi:DNA-binding MarR family transcriptional regulator